MTKPKEWEELKRPRRLTGHTLRECLYCPLCGWRPLRVVAFRRRTARLECRVCELRFSVDIDGFARSMLDHADDVVLANAKRMDAIKESGGNPRAAVQRAGLIAFRAHGVAEGRRPPSALGRPTDDDATN